MLPCSELTESIILKIPHATIGVNLFEHLSLEIVRHNNGVSVGICYSDIVPSRIVFVGQSITLIVDGSEQLSQRVSDPCIILPFRIDHSGRKTDINNSTLISIWMNGTF